MAESEEELKSLLMRVKEENGKTSLKLNMKITKVMASGPITSWQIEGEKAEGMTDFLFLGSKIAAVTTAAMKLKVDDSLEESFDQPRQHIKIIHTTLSTKAHIVKAMVFPVVMYGCKSWTIKKAEGWRTDAFKLWCCKRLLRLPWTEGNQTSQS